LRNTIIIIALTCMLFTCTGILPAEPPELEKGKVVKIETAHGGYLQYVPRSYDGPPKVLVVVHGTVKKGQDALDWSEKFILRWLEYAEAKKVILIAPGFDMQRYQVDGGYRALFGRDIGADEFLNLAVDQLKKHFPDFDGNFSLYGHSAGAQFGVRYSVRHPGRLHQVVLSAPGRYAYPNPEVHWPYGAGRLQHTLHYINPDVTRTVDIQPDFNGWIKAAQLPITIVLGSADLEVQPKRPGQKGVTRIDYANSWAKDMKELAHKHGKKPNIKVVMVEGFGHSSKALTPKCQELLMMD
jgi:pimeloyl-ACP methyl ester carboxylesterase